MRQNKTAQQAKNKLRKHASRQNAIMAMRFFKTGPGEYGEGDRFIGVRVPQIRQTVKEFVGLPLEEIKKLVRSKIHEERMLGFLLCVHSVKMARKNKQAQRERQIVKFYMGHRKWLNNWDLIDVTVPTVLGEYLLTKDRSILYRWVKSSHLWERRIAVMATQAFIRAGDFKDTLQFCKMLLKENHDLIHKASGWMLREIGKRDVEILYQFLDQHGPQMPRTMLRYAIEKLPETKRRQYLTVK